MPLEPWSRSEAPELFFLLFHSRGVRSVTSLVNRAVVMLSAPRTKDTSKIRMGGSAAKSRELREPKETIKVADSCAGFG